MLLSPAGGKRLLGGDDGLKIEAMTDATKTVLAEALRLDVDSRAELAAELLASLDGSADPDVEAAWAVEIERRVAAIDAGTTKLSFFCSPASFRQEDLQFSRPPM